MSPTHPRSRLLCIDVVFRKVNTWRASERLSNLANAASWSVLFSFSMIPTTTTSRSISPRHYASTSAADTSQSAHSAALSRMPCLSGKHRCSFHLNKGLLSHSLASHNNQKSLAILCIDFFRFRICTSCEETGQKRSRDYNICDPDPLRCPGEERRMSGTQADLAQDDFEPKPARISLI